MKFEQMKEHVLKEMDQWEEMAGRRGLSQHAKQFAQHMADMLNLALNGTQHARLRPSNALAVLAMAKQLAFQEWKADRPETVSTEPLQVRADARNAVGYFAHVGRISTQNVWEAYGQEVERVKNQHWLKWSAEFEKLEAAAKASGLYKEN